MIVSCLVDTPTTTRMLRPLLLVLSVVCFCFSVNSHTIFIFFFSSVVCIFLVIIYNFIRPRDDDWINYVIINHIRSCDLLHWLLSNKIKTHRRSSTDRFEVADTARTELTPKRLKGETWHGLDTLPFAVRCVGENTHTKMHTLRMDVESQPSDFWDLSQDVERESENVVFDFDYKLIGYRILESRLVHF